MLSLKLSVPIQSLKIKDFVVYQYICGLYYFLKSVVSEKCHFVENYARKKKKVKKKFSSGHRDTK